jgi:hypothetical protein
MIEPTHTIIFSKGEELVLKFDGEGDDGDQYFSKTMYCWDFERNEKSILSVKVRVAQMSETERKFLQRGVDIKDKTINPADGSGESSSEKD